MFRDLYVKRVMVGVGIVELVEDVGMGVWVC